MHSTMRRAGLVLVPALVCCAPAWAQQLPKPLSDPVTGREAFLTAAIAAMMLCGLLSFLLLGRASERTHVALAMLGVLTGGFGLLVLFGGLLYESPVAAVVVLLALIAMFKFMSLFEGGRKPNPKPSKE
jgi:peptidoglycan/LPS O-acetylase OafA/YrhL